ncbi:insulinase family protein [Patescibacteria group bacterium AH-259-L07]|nr:insulinase family protein [Patescibacteria group bacterium AH-259-L07]
MQGIERKEFKNGLVLLTEKRSDAEKAVLFVGVGVGSVNENDQLNGASHFNEHMLFKSNPYRSAKQIVEDLEAAGTSLKAFTSRRRTVFYTRSLPNKISEALEIFYQAATNFEYDEHEFEREREEEILTEIRRDIESPREYVYRYIFLPTLFKGTSFQRPIAGTEKSMAAIQKEELENFKQRFYVPNNMTIVVVGKFDQEELENEINKTFAKLELREYPCQNLKVAVDNQSLEKFETRGSVNSIYLNLGFKVPGARCRDVHKLKLLDGILSSGFSCRLFQRLRTERDIGNVVGSWLASFGDVGHFFVYVYGFDPKRFTETKEIILNEFEDLKMNPVTDKELRKTKNKLISVDCDNLELLETRARNILLQEFDNLPYDFRKSPEYIKGITKQDVQETAQKYLTDQHTLTALVPEGFKA